MKVRRLIEASILDPETLHVVFQAFDDAWSEIAHHFDGHGEQARLRLAHALLIVVHVAHLAPSLTRIMAAVRAIFAHLTYATIRQAPLCQTRSRGSHVRARLEKTGVPAGVGPPSHMVMKIRLAHIRRD